MSADLDRVLSASLQAHVDAGSPIDPQPLLHTAVERGRRLRVRRRVVTTALMVTAVAGAAITTVLLPRHHPATPLSPDPSSSARAAVNLARLPAADGQPGAAARPDLVGSDPGLLHFSVDALAASSWRVTWTSEAGMETADVQRFDFQVFVALATSRPKLDAPRLGYAGYPGMVLSDPVPATVGDHPATLRTSTPWEDKDQKTQARLYSFEWQPVAGLWARGDVQTTSQERAVQILGQVRLDQARRCALPMRLGALPATTTVGDCSVALAEDSPGVFSSGSVTVADGKRRLKVQAEAVPPGAGDYPRPLKAGPYQVFADSDGSWTMLVDGVFVTASPASRKDRFTQAEVLRILGDIRFADRVHDPATW